MSADMPGRATRRGLDQALFPERLRVAELDAFAAVRGVGGRPLWALEVLEGVLASYTYVSSPWGVWLAGDAPPTSGVQEEPAKAPEENSSQV